MEAILRSPRTFKPSSARSGITQFSGDAPVTTTDNTATVIASLPLAELEAVAFDALVLGRKSDHSACIVAKISGAARRASGGNVTLIGTPTVTIQESGASTDFAVAANTTAQTVEFKGTGISAETWVWELFGTKFSV